MLIANLNYYPDSRSGENGRRLGRVIFQKQDSRELIGFIEGKPDLNEARLDVADPILASILEAPGSFLRRLSMNGDPNRTELDLARAIASSLPYNFSIEEPYKPEPPEMEELFALVASEEAENRPTFADPLIVA